MKRTAILAAALGLLALTAVLGATLPGRNSADRPQPLLNARTGEPLTLEVVVQDIAWHRETARKLRGLD